MLPLPFEFPIHHLPEPARLAVLEVQQNVGAPLALAVASALNAMFLSCQQLIDVRRGERLRSPCSAFLLLILASGERKSAIENLFMAPIRDFEMQMADKYRSELDDYEANLKVWQVTERAILKAIEKGAMLNAGNDHSMEALREHMRAKPKSPRQFRYIFVDTTPEALLFSLHTNWPSAGLVSDESDGILNGRAIKSFAPYNLAWDGANQSVDRKSGESFTLSDVRLGISMMIQPNAFDAFMKRRGDEAIGTGFLARFLVARPFSTQGSRFIGQRVQSWQHLPVFQERVRALTERSYQAVVADVPRTELRFSPEAQRQWCAAHDYFEQQLGVGGCFNHIKEHTAKAADNLARMAAVFHYFNGGEGDIPLEIVNAAWGIIQWYENEYARIFPPPTSPVSQFQRDFQEVERWLNSCSLQQRYVKKNRITQYSKVRTVERVDPVLWSLQAQGRIHIFNVGRAIIIDFQPQRPPHREALQFALDQR